MALNRWHLFIVIIASFLSYSSSINGDFVFDDTEAIVNNDDVNGNTPLKDIFYNDFWGTRITHNSSHKSYRPLTIICFRILRYMSLQIFHLSNDSPVFHLINIILFTIVCLLLMKVIKDLLNATETKDLIYNEKFNRMMKTKDVCFLVGLTFAVHPIHTESVCAAVGMADLLSAIFALIAIDYYTVSSARNSFKDVLCQSIVVTALSAIAMLFKEQGLTAIGICFFMEISFSYHEKGIKRNIFFYRMSSLLFGSITLILIRLSIIGFSPPSFHSVDNPASFEENFFIRMINHNYIYALNIWILIFPQWLCFDWSMGCVPLIKDYFDIRLLCVLLFWITFLIIIKISIFHENFHIKRNLKISLIFIVIPFIPSSNIFFRVGFVIAERALFLPSIGFIMLIYTGFELITKNPKVRISRELFWLLIVIFAARTVHRCYDWKTEKQLFESGLFVCPLNAKVHYNIGKNAADNGNKKKAIEAYRTAIKLNPEYDHAMNNLANILKDNGDFMEAKELLLNATTIRPSFAAAWMNLGIIQTALKEYESAELSYFNAIKFRWKYPECLYNLGNLYVIQKRYDDAYNAWKNATFLNPKLLVAWNNMIIMLDNMKDYQRAHNIALEALKYHINESSLFFNYANVLGKMEKFEESEYYFLRAIKESPENGNFYANLGVLYHRWKLYEKALYYYEKALSLDSNLLNTKNNLNSLLRLLNKNEI